MERTVVVSGFIIAMALPFFSNSSVVAVTEPSPIAIVDDADPGWVWNGMTEIDDPQLRDGSGHAGGPHSFGAYTFNGVAVEVHGPAGPTVEVNGHLHKAGKLRVSIDGKTKEVITVSRPDVDPNACLFHCDGLTPGNHVLQLEADSGWVAVDYIVVTKSVDPALDNGDDRAPGKEPVAIPEGDYRICPATATSMGLDVIGAGTADGTGLQLYPTTQGKQPNQWFHVEVVDKGKIAIMPLNSPSKVISLLQPTRGGAIDVGIWANYRYAAQVWAYSVTDAGYFRLSPSNEPNLALTANGGVAQGSHVDCESWSGQLNQQWILAVN